MIYNDIITRGIEMERIMNISKWSKEDIRLALERSGYGMEEDLISVRFAGVNDRHQAVFDIAYPGDLCGSIDYGKVYVYIDKSGELIADY